MTNAEVVVSFAKRLWGDEWLDPMIRFTGVNQRTLQRIYAASRARQDYPAARGVIAALHERLTAEHARLAAALAYLEPFARRADQQGRP